MPSSFRALAILDLGGHTYCIHAVFTMSTYSMLPWEKWKYGNHGQIRWMQLPETRGKIGSCSAAWIFH